MLLMQRMTGYTRTIRCRRCRCRRLVVTVDARAAPALFEMIGGRHVGRHGRPVHAIQRHDAGVTTAHTAMTAAAAAAAVATTGAASASHALAAQGASASHTH